MVKYSECRYYTGKFSLEAVKLTKNPDPDKYKYARYGIGFDVRGFSSLSDGSEFGKSAIIFVADMSSLVHIDNKKKDILILGKIPTDWLDDTALTAEKKYSVNLTEHQKKFCFSLHYNRSNGHIFFNSVEIYKLKAKDSEISATPLFLGNVSKDFSVDVIKNTELYGYVYDFLVDFDSIDIDDILDIHNY